MFCLRSSSLPWFSALFFTLIFISVFVTISPFPCLAWSQRQQPTPLCALTPSFMPLPLGVAAIVVSNKVYGITDLWNWIFSLHQSSRITALRPVASGHNWPVTELFFFFLDCVLKVGRSGDSGGVRQADLCTDLGNIFHFRQASSLRLCMFLLSPPLSQTPTVLTAFALWSCTNLMNLLILFVWHPDTAQIFTPKVCQFLLILKTPLVKEWILTISLTFVWKELWYSIANLEHHHHHCHQNNALLRCECTLSTEQIGHRATCRNTQVTNIHTHTQQSLTHSNQGRVSNQRVQPS